MLIETHLEQLKKMSILIATPMYGGMCAGVFTDALSQVFHLAGKYGLSVQFRQIGNESLITRARNGMAHYFLKETNCTHLLFIDADIGFNPIDLFSLAAQADQETGKSIVCATYPKKGIDWSMIKRAVQAGAADNDPDNLEALGLDFPFDIELGSKTTFDLNSVMEVRYAGTGFMMIRRDVFEDLEPHLKDQRYLSTKPDKDGKADMVTAFFDCIIDDKTNVYLSEDYTFCIRAREVGHKIWICPWIKLGHVGTHIYKGGIPDFALANLPIKAVER